MIRFVLLAALSVFASAPALAAGDPDRGEKVYEGCQDCHSLDKNDVGPRHRGVFGRKAGSLTDFAYSPALKGAGFVWTEETLDKWLTNPQAFLPGARMFYHLGSAWGSRRRHRVSARAREIAGWDTGAHDRGNRQTPLPRTRAAASR